MGMVRFEIATGSVQREITYTKIFLSNTNLETKQNCKIITAIHISKLKIPAWAGFKTAEEKRAKIM
jgi:hypothetical protein